ncbi:uncharacterized protein LOC120126887 [Hibiscus syriacus]|uniref:uncharacterized protein LOC120126887 n=1 Tax=Hibiscus syriacus TaxID=106335 RepID=UPI0019208FCC|nr:uncharacterized protein LOC120126887 [Hibiscus syriacus]
MAIKVDLEKAYDRLECDYIEDTLNAVGLLEKFISRIMTCAIEEKMDLGAWKQIRLSRNGPGLSHLFFADDVVLFAEASTDQINVIREVLDRFCEESGHRISVTKTQFFSLKTAQGVGETTLLRALGLRSVIWEGWAAKSLSLVGRVTLAKAVLQTIRTYVLQSTWNLENYARKLRKSLAVLFGVRWRHGIHDLYRQNKAFLLKVGFRLLTKPDKLWVQVIRSKYKWEDPYPLTLRHGSGSQPWKGLQRIWNDFSNISWNVRNGQEKDFWYDHWLDAEDRLVFSYTGSTSPNPTPVCDMCLPSGTWDWGKLSTVLPEHILQRIAAVQPPQASFGPNFPGWR